MCSHMDWSVNNVTKSNHKDFMHDRPYNIIIGPECSTVGRLYSLLIRLPSTFLPGRLASLSSKDHNSKP